MLESLELQLRNLILCRLYIEALLADSDLADRVWRAWNVGLIAMLKRSADGPKIAEETAAEQPAFASASVPAPPPPQTSQSATASPVPPKNVAGQAGGKDRVRIEHGGSFTYVRITPLGCNAGPCFRSDCVVDVAGIPGLPCLIGKPLADQQCFYISGSEHSGMVTLTGH